jgi:hypothetical protein
MILTANIAIYLNTTAKTGFFLEMCKTFIKKDHGILDLVVLPQPLREEIIINFITFFSAGDNVFLQQALQCGLY